MKFWLGLAIGAAVGSAAMYLGMTQPWSRREPAAVIAAAPIDAGAPAPGKRKRRRGGGSGGGGGGGAAGEELAPAVVLTEADRRLEWRGDEVALPASRVDMAGGGADGRALEGGEIQATIARDGQAMLDCIVKATGQAELEATVTVKLLVDPTGRAVKSRVHAPAYLFGNGLLACARRAIGTLGFPATGAHTVVTQPFELF